MLLHESFCRAKSGLEDSCEDAFYFSESFAAVIDGATDKTGVRYDGLLGGRWAALRIGAALGQLGASVSPMEAVVHLSAALKEAGGTGDRPSASVAVYSRHRRELWQVGDVTCHLVRGSALEPVTNDKRIDSIAAEARRAMLETALVAGASIDELRASDPGRALILPLLQSQFRLRNAPAGFSLRYGAIDGGAVPPDLIRVSRVPNDVEAIILTSDGYPIVHPNWRETEVELAGALKRDPLCIGELLGTKGVRPEHESFDDRTYLRFDPALA